MSSSGTTDEGLEKGRRFFSLDCVFSFGANSVDGIPPAHLPEIAFAGRSNVGKSSLINALTHRRSLARVSKTPGRTQQINFFTLGEKIMLVDLPGYGYAQVSKTTKADWSDLIQQYLKGRPTLRRVYLLVDARHGIKPVDQAIMKILDNAAVPYYILLTKGDKVSRAELDVVMEGIAVVLKKHTAAFPHIHVTSSENSLGIEELRASISDLA